MYIDEEAVGLLFRLEKTAHWTSQRFVITRHDKHRDRFPIILTRPDDQMSQHSRQRRTGRADTSTRQPVTKCECDSVPSRTMYGTFFDRNNTLGSAFVMPHDEAAATGSWTEYECDLLPEALGSVGIEIYRNE
jgi:hypothetical protein